MLRNFKSQFRKLVVLNRYFNEVTTILRRERSTSTVQVPSSEYVEEEEYPPGWHTAKSYQEIPGPKSLPIVGNIWRFLPVFGTYYGMDQLAQHKTFYETFGTILKLSGLKIRNDIVLLFDPDDFEMLFRNEGVWPLRNGLPSLVDYKVNVREDIFQGQGGVLANQGKDWYYTRSIVNPPLLQPRFAYMYLSHINEVSDEFMEIIRRFTLKNNGLMPKNFSREIHKWALESICVVALNKRLGLLVPDKPLDKDVSSFIEDVMDMFVLLNELDVKPSIWKWISTPTHRKFIKTLNRITNFEKQYLDEALLKSEKEGDVDKPLAQMSILEQLMKKDKKVALAMVFDMMIAGIDTTSRTLAAALYYISANPDVQQKLHDELKRYLPRKDTPITKEILNELRYLKATIKETTRLAPIAIGNLRQTPKNLVLAGYQIPKNTEVLSGNMFLCRQEKYFPRPNEFIPDRWLREGGDVYQSDAAHPFVFMPFGFGPRSCIGRRFANLEMEVLTAKICRSYVLSWPHEEMKWIMEMLYGVGSPLEYHMTPVQD